MRSTASARLVVRLLLGAITATFIVAAGAPQPAGAAPLTIRVLQWNTYHGGYGTDGVYNQDRQVWWIAGLAPDVISLNEVKASQAASYETRLENATGVEWHSFHVPAQADGTGNQILSRHRIISTSSYRMVSNGQYSRAVAQATIEIAGRWLNFFSAHLDHADQVVRRAQAAELHEFANGFPEPRIVAGDFNAVPTSAEMSLLTAEWIDGWEAALNANSATAYAPDNPANLQTRTLRERIDFILVSERSALTVRAGDMPDTRDLANTNVTRIIGTPDDTGVRPSDHNPLVAVIELAPESTIVDTTPPSVALLEPVVNAELTAGATARAAASDDVAVTKVQFVIDGQAAGMDRWEPYELAIDPNRLAVGTHTIEAIATDAAGNQQTSGTRQFTVGSGLAATDEIVLYAADASVVAGKWLAIADAAVAGGVRLHHPNAGAAKVITAAAAPANYFEMVFDAAAGQPYRLWMRLHAEKNHYNNDSVHVQFDGAVSATGAPVFRIGTTASAEVNLEDCSGCGISGWGWQDNGWGVGVLGPEIRFATHGQQRIRVQTREDGVSVDQIVLSASRYRTLAPGSLKNDTTILQKALPPPPAVNQPPTVVLSAPASSSQFIAPATITVTATAADSDGTIQEVQFFAGPIAIGTVTSAPYTLQWTNVPAGDYLLTARAVDDDGAMGTAESLIVTVVAPPPAANEAPRVTLSSPSPSAEFVAPATISVSATAEDVDGTIQRVEFFAGTTPIGVATAAPYTIQWADAAAGTYALTARAIDDGGAAGTAAAVTITVVPAPPVSPISLTGGTFQLGNRRGADLSWAGTTVSWVNIFRDDELVATVKNKGSFLDELGEPRTSTYRVCEAGTQICSNVVTVVF